MTQRVSLIVVATVSIAPVIGGNAAPGDKPALNTQAPDPDPPYRGLAIQVHGGGDVVARYGPLLREVAELGADTVLLSADGFQEDIDSVVIEADAGRCPSDRRWLALFDFAHDRGLRVVLMPKVLLSDPRQGAWRGKLAPVSWKAWFDQYTRFVLRFARLAAKGGVEVLVIGSELVTTEKHTAQWRRIIQQVRRVYPGKLAYSANWDHFKGIRFWEDLDFIGMTTYYSLNKSKQADPAVSDLRKAWQQIQADILAWQAKIGRPLLFTEVGWCSQEGCSIQPWNYYHFEKATPAGHQEQRDNYQAFIDTWADRPEVGGIIWWEWTGGPGGDDDYQYTPKGKPAQEVLGDFFERLHTPVQATAAESSP